MTSRGAQQFCTFVLDGHMFGTPVAMVQEVIQQQQLTRVPLAPEVVSGMINLRGQIVCALDLRRRLNLPVQPGDHAAVNVVVRTDEEAASLVVDEIGDVIEVAAEAHEDPPETLQGVAREVIKGVYKLPHDLLLVLDIGKIVDLGETVKPKRESSREP